MGFGDISTEKRIFQKLLDGGVYIVCPSHKICQVMLRS